MRQFNSEVNQKDFELGALYAKGYISFCMTNTVYKIATLHGIATFISDLTTFLKGASYMPNTQNLTFKEFCESYSFKE